MKFKTRMINAAVAAALGTVAGAAQAVNLGAEGHGQVLIYPYYSVQTKGTSNAFDTYVSIVNSDSVNGKAVKVRFLEGKNSQEVLDFNLYLSPNDMWTAAVTRDASGNAMLRTSDTSCTAPAIPLNTAVGPTNREVSFVNFAYSTDAVKDGTLARAKEGYLEVIQMADLISGLKNNDGLDTWLASKHVNGVPPNCAAIINSWLGTGYANNAGVALPTGFLSGAGTLINPNEGTMASYRAVPLHDFTQTRLHFAPGDFLPNLENVNPKVSGVVDGASLVVTDWTGVAPLNVPVTATLIRADILNEYALAAAPVGLGTDWIVTMPTKRAHVLGPARAPYTSVISTTGACEAVTLTAYNREEAVQTSGLQFSPSQVTGNSLCWEVNVVSMNSSAVTSNVLGGVTTRLALTLPFTEGWLRMSFAQTLIAPVASSTRITYTPGPLAFATTNSSATYTGLPAVGFAVQSIVNTSSLASYGSDYEHRYHRRITLP